MQSARHGSGGEESRDVRAHHGGARAQASQLSNQLRHPVSRSARRPARPRAHSVLCAGTGGGAKSARRLDLRITELEGARAATVAGVSRSDSASGTGSPPRDQRSIGGQGGDRRGGSAAPAASKTAESRPQE